MPKVTLEQLGPLIKERRGNRGLREVAAEIGTSAATLSRIEAGKQPDLDTFSKLCHWLKIDASEILGCAIPNSEQGQESTVPSPLSEPTAPILQAHFRATRTMNPETARHLGELILAVHRAVIAEEADTTVA